MNSLESQIRDAIKDRAEWEERQRAWYQVRHRGIPRRAKPYPGAPDNHFPLVDAAIDKHKPFYVQQIYGTETLAAFVSKVQQDAEKTTAVGAWFDYQVKQCSNFEREAICGIDTLLQNGGCPVKIFWNAKCKRLEFDSCDPLHVIVPKWTEELKDADFLVHVLQMSEAQYRANPNYNKDDDFVKSIKGKGNADAGDSSGKDQEIASREGITYGSENQIILWEIYTRGEGSAWNEITVKTRSPLRFEEPARSDFRLPYSKGVFTEGCFPYVKWRGEIKDKGYNSPRGLAEILAPNEQFLNKILNFIGEHMDFHARPAYRQEANSTVGNTGNFKKAPGSIMPMGLVPDVPPPLPPFLMEMMNYTRESSEYRVQAPDFGVLAQEGGKRTAHEVEAISQQTGMATTLRAIIFRKDLADTYGMAWAILLQFGHESLDFILDGGMQKLAEDALHGDYEVRPSGSADSWNKQAQSQKAVGLFQLFNNHPFIQQGPLAKNVLENDSAGLVKKLYQEPQDAQAGESEEQAMEIGIMLLGFPAAIDPTDDDKAHLVCLAQYVQQSMQNQEPIEPRFARLALKHGAEHTNALHQKKDPAAKQINQQLMPVIQILSQIAAQPDPRELAAAQAQQAAQQNVIPMQSGSNTQAGAATSPAPVAPELQPQTHRIEGNTFQ